MPFLGTIISLGRNVYLKRISDAIPEEVKKHLNRFHFWDQSEQHWWSRYSSYAITLEYDPKELIQGAKTTVHPGFSSDQPHAVHILQHASQAVWLAEPCAFSFEVILHCEYVSDAWTLLPSPRVAPLVPLEVYSRQMVKHEDLVEACKFHEAMHTIPQGTALATAIDSLWKGLVEDIRKESWEVKYLLLWIALEALFGPEEARELSYRLAQRIAFFIEETREDAHTTFDSARVGYKVRSKVVHGRRAADKIDQKEEDLIFKTEKLVRRALRKILLNQSLVEKFSSKNGREKYLDGLVFFVDASDST